MIEVKLRCIDSKGPPTLLLGLESAALQRLSDVHKVIFLSQRAFTVASSKGKDTRFHIKAKVPYTVPTIVALLLRGSDLFKKLLAAVLVNWNSHILFTYILSPAR